jgi:DNA (cytosine-5)-methyltransferase 1
VNRWIEAKNAGFRLVGAIDTDPAAVATYRTNVGREVICGDAAILGLSMPTTPDLIIGGPPCQGFSVIGKMAQDDPRSRHVSRFMDVVEARQPLAFVMENVKALGTNPRWLEVRQNLETRARLLGFQVRTFVLNAADYGVPQVRERMFLVGIKGQEPSPPKPTTSKNHTSVRMALEGLPAYGEPGNDELVPARIVPAKKPVMRPSPFQGSLLFNGSGRPLRLDKPARTLPASMGGNATPIVDQEELLNDARPWVLDYHAHLLAGGEPRKRAPRQLRRITVQEAAVLQSFPSSWKFAGSQVARLRQIGNAVPPRMSLHVAKSIRASLANA